MSGAETLHGIARTLLLAPRVGKVLAIQSSVVTGTVLAFGLCDVFVPGIGATGLVAHLFLGLGLSGFMAAFDVVLARRVMRFTWSRIWADFDPRRGNDLSIGLVLLVLSPSIVWWFRGVSAA